MHKLLQMKFIYFIIMILLSGCATTALYGNKFEPAGNGKHSYTLKIYFGAPVTYTRETIEISTSSRLNEEAMKFIDTNSSYTNFNIIRSEVDMTNRYIIYTVNFN